MLVSPEVAEQGEAGRERVTGDPATGVHAAVYRLAEGTELLGAFQDSGYAVAKYMLSRSDGQVMQLPRLLYRVAASLDGRSVAQIAAELGPEFGTDLTAEDVAFLITDRLCPVGVIAPDEDKADDGGRDHARRAGDAGDTAVEGGPAPVKSDPLLSLRYRVGMVPAGVVWRIAGIFRHLFARPVWLTALAAFLAVHALVIEQGGLIDRATAGVLQLIHHPVLILVVLGLSVVDGAFHECGHVTACRYGGATPGDMGVGLYLVWPAYYSTVTDSYRLSRVGRLRTDLGGVYFDAIFMTALSGIYLATGQPWLLLAVIGLLVETAYQFFPSIRFDGFYILSDLVGVPDLFGFVGPVLSSLVPGRPRHPKVAELRPWARRLIVLWVVLSIPVILFGLTAFLVAAPRVLPVVWSAMQEYLHTVDTAVRTGDVVTTALDVLQLFLLLLPWLGSLLMLWRVLQMAYRFAGRRWGRLQLSVSVLARLRGLLALCTVGGLAAAVVVRVAIVAGSMPASVGENRLVTSALATVDGTSGGPTVGPAEFLAQQQLVWYARLTGAFSRHASVMAGGRELAVVATAVVVVCLAALAFTHRISPRAASLPLAAALVMGPVVTVLAAMGPGVLGAAWTAAGALLLLGTAGRTAAVSGLLAVTVGLVTAPVTAAPLALGLVLLLATGRTTARHATTGPRHARPEGSRASVLRWSLVALALPAASLAAYLGTRPGDLPADASVRTLVVAVAVVVVAAALRHRSLHPPAAVAAGAVVLAGLPWPGAGSALAGAVAAVALLGALLVHVGRAKPPGERSHPLVRAAGAVPVLVLVLVGVLFLPSTSPTVPTDALAAWITGPSSGGRTVAVPATLWGQLVRDGVPPDRLARTDSAAADTAGWTVALGDATPGARPAATFGSGGTALTVQLSAAARTRAEQQQVEDDARRRAAEVQQAAEDQQRATGAVLGRALVDSGRVRASDADLAALRLGTLDERALAVLTGLTGQGRRVSLGDLAGVQPQGAAGADASRITVVAIDGRPAASPDTAAALTQWLQSQPEAVRPAQVAPGPSGLVLSWPPGSGAVPRP